MMDALGLSRPTPIIGPPPTLAPGVPKPLVLLPVVAVDDGVPLFVPVPEPNNEPPVPLVPPGLPVPPLPPEGPKLKPDPDDEEPGLELPPKPEEFEPKVELGVPNPAAGEPVPEPEEPKPEPDPIVLAALTAVLPGMEAPPSACPKGPIGGTCAWPT